MDTGLRRYDGTESVIDAQIHRCTCIFEGHEDHEVRKFLNLRVLRAFVVNTLSQENYDESPVNPSLSRGSVSSCARVSPRTPS